MGDYNHEAPDPIDISQIQWNTHNMIRERFSYPLDSEFFGEWLEWFYGALNKDQRRELRKVPLSEVNVNDYPAPPQPRLF